MERMMSTTCANQETIDMLNKHKIPYNGHLLQQTNYLAAFVRYSRVSSGGFYDDSYGIMHNGNYYYGRTGDRYMSKSEFSWYHTTNFYPVLQYDENGNDNTPILKRVIKEYM